jgi:hypothetical protein
MKEKINENEKAGNAFMDFKRNFEDMNATRLEGGDKYFYCKANYEAASRGWVGKMTSKILSDVKEMKDMYIDADPSIESQTDQIANYHGREAVLSGKYTSAKEACAIFRPKGLDDKYKKNRIFSLEGMDVSVHVFCDHDLDSFSCHGSYDLGSARFQSLLFLY